MLAGLDFHGNDRPLARLIKTAGYGLAVVGLPVFAASGVADAVWHTIFGIETSTRILFSPSHLALIGSGLLIMTSPLRGAWSDPALARHPPLRAVLLAVVTLALGSAGVLLFLTYANALVYVPGGVVGSFSAVDDSGAEELAARMVVTTLVLLSPLLLLTRRWSLPRGAATLVYGLAAVVPGTLTAAANLPILLAVLGAGVAVDVLAWVVDPDPSKRGAFCGFAAVVAFSDGVLYLGVASLLVGRVPAVTEYWTGAPVVMALLCCLLAV